MSFVSIDFKRSELTPTPKFIYSLVDSDFGEVEIGFTPREEKVLTQLTQAVVNCYSERKLPVARNLALATICIHNWPGVRSAFTLEEFMAYQVKSLPNLAKCFYERDKHMEKLLPLL